MNKVKRRFNVPGNCVPDKHYMVDTSNKLTQVQATKELFVMEFIKCPNCNENVLPNTICPICGYDDKNKTLIEFSYEDDTDNLFSYEDELSNIEKNNLENQKETSSDEWKHIKRKYFCIKILLIIILTVNLIYLFNYLLDKYAMNQLYVIGTADNKVLAVKKDEFSELFKLIEDSGEISLLDSSNKTGYNIIKYGKINSSDARIQMYFEYNDDKILYMYSFTIDIQNIIENTEQTFQLLNQFLSDLFGDCATMNSMNGMFINIWNYEGKTIQLQVLNMEDSENYQYIHLYVYNNSNY